MAILDYFLHPSLLEINDPNKIGKIQQSKLLKLEKRKTKKKTKICIHEIQYQKWVHKGRKEGVKDTFHYKEVCNKCGMKRCVERTKEIYELVKDQPWHYKKRTIKGLKNALLNP